MTRREDFKSQCVTCWAAEHRVSLVLCFTGCASHLQISRCTCYLCQHYFLACFSGDIIMHSRYCKGGLLSSALSTVHKGCWGKYWNCRRPWSRFWQESLLSRELAQQCWERLVQVNAVCQYKHQDHWGKRRLHFFPLIVYRQDCCKCHGSEVDSTDVHLGDNLKFGASDKRLCSLKAATLVGSTENWIFKFDDDRMGLLWIEGLLLEFTRNKARLGPFCLFFSAIDTAWNEHLLAARIDCHQPSVIRFTFMQAVAGLEGYSSLKARWENKCSWAAPRIEESFARHWNQKQKIP